MVDTVNAIVKMGLKVEWMDRVLCEIGSKRYHFVMLREARLLRLRLEELQQENDDVRGLLGGIGCSEGL